MHDRAKPKQHKGPEISDRREHKYLLIFGDITLSTKLRTIYDEACVSCNLEYSDINEGG